MILERNGIAFRLALLAFLLMFVISTPVSGAQHEYQEQAVVDKEEEPAEEPPEVDLSKSISRISYAMGYKIGDMFQNLKLTIIPDAVLKGMYDARKNIRPALTKAEIKLILRDPKRYMIEDIESVAQKNEVEENLFLQANAKREGVVTLDSGLQYSVMRSGTGKKPKSSDLVKINYKGRTLKGYVFDNTYIKGEPSKLAITSLLPGMAEALLLMQEGAKWEIYLPNALAYGNQGPMAGQALIFEVELLEVMP
ncbi:MAG: hypothetical protein C0623_02440 [Desulfuromonas sp.]|nr:MAG: hypothetical protein C0623_02440 [Desulfuromonas sp.]